MLIYPLLILFILPSLYGKFFEDKLSINSLSHRKWQYLTKFGIDLDGGTIEARLQIMKFQPRDSEAVKFDLFLYNEETWNMQNYFQLFFISAIDEKSCINKREIANERIIIYASKNEKFTEWVAKSIASANTPHIWYIAIADCDNILSKYKFQSASVKVELILKNNNSHFSIENQGMQRLYFIQMIITMAFVAFIYRRLVNQKKNEQDHDSIYFFILVSLGCDLIGELLIYIHLEVYGYDGEGFFIASFLGQFLNQCAQFLVSYMLILLATGYTIETRKIQHPEFYTPIGIILLVVQLMIVGISKLSDNSYSKYHDYSGIPGLFIFLFKISLVIWFLVNVHYYRKQKKDGPATIFLNRLQIFGSIYFIIFPLVMILSDLLVEPYLRHKAITIGTLLFQHIAMLLMIYAFGSKKGTYQIISQRGKGLII